MSNVTQMKNYVRAGSQQKKKRKKFFVGNPPAGGVPIAKTPGWTLYHLPEKSSGGWMSLKLISTDKIPGKANYWLGWNGERFSVTPELNALIENQPALSRLIWSELGKKYPAA